MDAQQFLAEFGHIANAPNGVPKLRELVLVLAMQGRLLPQATGESAASLVEAISAEKQSLIASGALRSPKTLPLIAPNDRSYVIPGNWCWARFGEISTHNSGKTLDAVRNSGQFRDYITTSNLYWGRFDLSNVRQMLIRDEELEKCTARKGDLLICEGGEAGRAAVWTDDREVCFQNHVHRARFFGGVNPFFVYRFFEKLNMTAEINAYRKGIGISNLSSKALAMIAVPLPPLEEQSRIVAKIDELMALCDRLEKQQQDRRRLQNALRESTLQVCATAESPHELQESWQRLQANFGRLFNEPSDTNSLKSLLLKLSMRGLLVSQKAGDMHAGTLLQQVATEKARLIAAKKLKTSTAVPAPSDAELPYALPNGWTWARVVDLVDVGTGATPAKSESDYYGGDTPWYTSSATNEKFALKPQTFITEKALAETNCKIFPAGSLIVAMYGQGKTRGQVSELVVAGATNQAIAALVFFESSKRTKRYLKYFFEKIYDEVRLQAEGGPQPNLSVGKIKEILVPVPPLEEQERIVARLDELLEQCNEWRSQLKQRAVLARQFAALAVAEITGIANEGTEDVALKAPQTELIAPLRLGTLPDVKDQAPLATLLARHRGEMPARDLWQRFGGEIDTFYAQLKTEVAHGWITEPPVAEVRAKTVETAGA
jgi:type I restriction enzyme, S subunit